jgi:hypothetical protein
VEYREAVAAQVADSVAMAAMEEYIPGIQEG